MTLGEKIILIEIKTGQKVSQVLEKLESGKINL